MNRVELERLWRDPRNWHLRCIYFCPSDPRIVVPKRIRWLGCTLNFARPLAIPFLLFLLAAGGAISDIAHGGADVRFDIEVLLTLGVIALCYLLWNPPERSDETSDHENRAT